MNIFNGKAKNKFDLYPTIQPQPDLSTFVWPNLRDGEEELNSIAQLMMLHRHSFLELEEEDSIIQSILNKTCVVKGCI